MKPALCCSKHNICSREDRSVNIPANPKKDTSYKDESQSLQFKQLREFLDTATNRLQRVSTEHGRIPYPLLSPTHTLRAQQLCFGKVRETERK